MLVTLLPIFVNAIYCEHSLDSTPAMSASIQELSHVKSKSCFFTYTYPLPTFIYLHKLLKHHFHQENSLEM